MPHIAIDNPYPGMRGLVVQRPDTGRLISDMANALLRKDEGLNPGEREFIAGYVSHLNKCAYCEQTHTAVAAAHQQCDIADLNRLKKDIGHKSLAPKLRSLLPIAAAVQRSGREVSEALLAAAREAGATDDDIHDTVLIAAFFCMCNRYVDGLATAFEADEAMLRQAGALLAEHGYGMSLK